MKEQGERRVGEVPKVDWSLRCRREERKECKATKSDQPPTSQKRGSREESAVQEDGRLP